MQLQTGLNSCRFILTLLNLQMSPNNAMLHCQIDVNYSYSLAQCFRDHVHICCHGINRQQVIVLWTLASKQQQGFLLAHVAARLVDHVYLAQTNTHTHITMTVTMHNVESGPKTDCFLKFVTPACDNIKRQSIHQTFL